jgi:hypothetical protein
MKPQSPVLAMAIAFGMISGACTSTSSPPSGSGGSSASESGGSSGSGGAGQGGKTGSGGAGQGGKTGSGGAGQGGKTGGGGTVGTGGGSGGGSVSCSDATNVEPCGGEVVGEWNVTSSCLKISGQLDISGIGTGCKSAEITDGSLQVTGTWTATSDGKYTDKTTTTGEEDLTLDSSCLFISGTTTTCDRIGGVIQGLGYALVECIDASGGGCTCKATVDQSGGMGLLSTDPSTSGRITTADNVVTTDSDTTYSYCVSGNTMTWSPQSVSPTTTTGTIVLQKAGTTGSGGGSGSGGATTGSGGRVGSGGATGGGGRTSGSGGAGGGTSAGGAGSGGRVGSGGATSAGGTSGGGTTGVGGTTGAGGTTSNGTGPCDIYAAANPATPCVAAYSMVRVLSSKYTGPLYQVRKGGNKTGSGGTTQDIAAKDGFGDGAAQDAFCGSGDTCTVSKLYDQSGKGNDLVVAKKGCYTGTASEDDYESDAKKRSLTVSGHKVYALYMVAHEGYRNNNGSGVVTGNGSQGVYEVADGKRIGAACCWDFGNASKDNCYGPTGSMNAIFFGTGYWGKGTGSGPWFMGDFEAGVWAGGSGASSAVNNNLPSSTMDYAFGILKSGPGNYAIVVGNAQSGSLTKAYDGNSPATWQMKGGIILGIGGDNSNSSQGTFFEGAMTSGRPSDATDALILQNVQAAGYGK